MQGDANYNRARFEEFNNAPCGNGQTIAEGCNQLVNPATRTLYFPGPRRAAAGPGAGVDGERRLRLRNTHRRAASRWRLASNTRYSDEFFTNLVELPEYIQDSYFKTSANIALNGQDDAWEVALIGNNLGNEITAGLCSNSNTQNGTVFGGQLAGGPVKGPAGSDELGCVAERGREIWIRLTYRGF